LYSYIDNDAAKVINQCWLEILPNHFPDMQIDKFIIIIIIIFNYLHSIIW